MFFRLLCGNKIILKQFFISELIITPCSLVASLSVYMTSQAEEISITIQLSSLIQIISANTTPSIKPEQNSVCDFKF